MPFALASSPLSGAPAGPQSSSPQPARTLIAERNSKRRMRNDRIPEAVVLYHVLEDSFEACAGPQTVERQGLAEEAELGLERVAIERRHLGVVGLVLADTGIDARVALLIEECRALPIVAVADR